MTSHVVQCDQWPSATLHEITSSPHPEERILLYFHGGGYRNPLKEAAHMPLVLEINKALNDDGAGRVFLLEYGLTPELQYPGQLVQSACALNLLLTQLECGLGQIVIAGDSAGGNLVLALLAHIKQPHPLVPKIESLTRTEKLKGALLISPWVSNAFTTESYKENAGKDYLLHESMESFTQSWCPERELWADFSQAPADFWRELPVERVLLTVGGFEVFRDDVRAFATTMEANADKDSLVRFVEHRMRSTFSLLWTWLWVFLCANHFLKYCYGVAVYHEGSKR